LRFQALSSAIGIDFTAFPSTEIRTLIIGLLESYLTSKDIVPAETISHSTRLEETLIPAYSLPGLSQAVVLISAAVEPEPDSDQKTEYLPIDFSQSLLNASIIGLALVHVNIVFIASGGVESVMSQLQRLSTWTLL
jgi:hypothetical protein